VLSRAQATSAIRDGRVRVDGRLVRDPLTQVILEGVRITVDETAVARSAWRTLLFHKPAGVVTTRRDPEGRRTIYDVLGEEGKGLIAVGRLDRATSGLLLLTNDTQLAEWITNPDNDIPRVYIVTVRGRVTPEDVATLTKGVRSGREMLRARDVSLRKSSGRESHLTVELREGKNREIRRLFESIGHEVTRLKRVRLGRLELGDLKPGESRPLTATEVGEALRAVPSQLRDLPK
jgi:pseudouridine synthase